MTEDALKQFQASDGFEGGVDGAVALIKVGVAGEINATSVANEPVVAFIYAERGLMANLSLEGQFLLRGSARSKPSGHRSAPPIT